MEDKSELILKDECYEIIGSCMRVHSDKGNGFHEPIYQECLEIDFDIEEVSFDPQAALKMEYRGRELKQRFVPDFLVFDQVVLEIKAVKKTDRRAPHPGFELSSSNRISARSTREFWQFWSSRMGTYRQH